MSKESTRIIQETFRKNVSDSAFLNLTPLEEERRLMPNSMADLLVQELPSLIKKVKLSLSAIRGDDKQKAKVFEEAVKSLEGVVKSMRSLK